MDQEHYRLTFTLNSTFINVVASKASYINKLRFKWKEFLERIRPHRLPLKSEEERIKTATESGAKDLLPNLDVLLSGAHN